MKIYFLLSAPRSGSTLLRLHMNEFEGVIALPETHLFEFILRNKTLNWSNKADRELIAEKWIKFYTILKFPINHEELKGQITSRAKNWRDLFELTIEQYRAEQYPSVSSPIWIEKSPPHIFYQPQIKSLFPEAKFIYLLRDPRAVIGSLKTMPWSTSNVYALARSWKSATQKFDINNQSIVIQYETLVKSPESEIKKLFVFMQLKGEFKLAESVGDNVEQQNWNSHNSFKPISTEHLEKWRKQLSHTDCDLQIIEHVCAKEMLQYNYQPENLSKNKKFYLNLCTSALKFGVIKLLG
jgi:hypothetical protein